MKTALMSFLASASLVVSAMAQPALSQKELVAILSAAAPNQNVSVSAIGGGYTFYGPKGTGRIIATGGSLKIYYDGQTRDAIRSGNGWNVYGGEKTVNIVGTRLGPSNQSGPLRIYGLGDSGLITTNGNGATAYYGGQSHAVVPKGSGLAIYAPPNLTRPPANKSPAQGSVYSRPFPR